MSYDPVTHLLLTPEDVDAPRRVARLRELGVGREPRPEFDAFARRLAAAGGAPFAMVNLIDGKGQYFAGLHTPETDRPPTPGADEEALPGRVMELDHGYCPHVVVRRRALVLEDVRDYSRFAGNPVVDALGIRAYMGAPITDHSGMALGTVCVMAREPMSWGSRGLGTIKAMADEMSVTIRRGVPPVDARGRSGS
ncbi:GAF domain-containing protein [Streptomyces sp. ST2-7A]|uniref:GAF domain-containing protein n=1 Tax=Streptomyces sp. ST2-7A TaxID=2907214 RepID=UPI001F25CA0E|nr:GAF domain-containing protein [Streptomyces sp. ST2-7A]MCE7083055.1 GAF domain-containing protein [Streptomyces sp. ST2-7A]